jgi:hypothetical protein
MIAAVLVLSLISLLVATDPETSSAPAQPAPEPPLRPEGKPEAKKTSEGDRLAA